MSPYAAVGIAAAALAVMASWRVPQARILFTEPTITGAYAEYPFSSGDDNDLGFTWRALDALRKERSLHTEGAAPLLDAVLKRVTPSASEQSSGAVDGYLYGDDRYVLYRPADEPMDGEYRMERNGVTLFTAQMRYGAERPILDARMVNGSPAFTFSPGDVWHDGRFISQAYGAERPRWLFTHDGKLGFVAAADGKDVIYFEGAAASPKFDAIWTHNCCASTEILPTIYDNGTLLFYARRGEKNFLVELDLQHAGKNDL